MAMHAKDAVFWDVIVYGLVGYRRFDRFYSIVLFYIGMVKAVRVVGPCHHGMARPQVADRGTASNMEGSCE